MAKERQTDKYIRVQMVESQSVEVSPDSFVHYRAGEFYMLPEETAIQWIKDGLAVESES